MTQKFFFSKFTVFILGCSIFLLLPNTAFANQVFLIAEKSGQGWLATRGEDCFLITPQHIIGNRRSAEVTSERAHKAQAIVVRKYAPDLAILRLSSHLPGCSEPAVLQTEISDALIEEEDAHLVYRLRSGAIQRQSVEIAGFDERFIWVTPEDFVISKGFSGSALKLGSRSVGMLLSVNSESGAGLALRSDYMSDVIKRFLPVERKSTRACDKKDWHIDTRSAEQIRMDRERGLIRCLVFVISGSNSSNFQGWIEWRDSVSNNDPASTRLGAYKLTDDTNLVFGRLPSEANLPSDSRKLTVILSEITWGLVNMTRVGWEMRSKLSHSAPRSNLVKLFTDVSLNAGIAEHPEYQTFVKAHLEGG